MKKEKQNDISAAVISASSAFVSATSTSFAANQVLDHPELQDTPEPEGENNIPPSEAPTEPQQVSVQVEPIPNSNNIIDDGDVLGNIEIIYAGPEDFGINLEMNDIDVVCDVYGGPVDEIEVYNGDETDIIDDNLY